MFRRGSSGELLLRLTYKGYVEDEEDDRAMLESMGIDVSDDESDFDESSSTYGQISSSGTDEVTSSNGTDKESFMDVLAALIVSEEFQGIVASANSRFPDQASKTGSRVPSGGFNAESSSPSDASSASGGSGGIAFGYCTQVQPFACIG